jgi:ABC-type uncharacterized transport system permease subunit
VKDVLPAMMIGLRVLCFAGTYALALGCDLTRFFLQTRRGWHLSVALTALGWLVQGAYLANLTIQTHHIPVTTLFESLLVLSWILTAIDLYLTLHARKPTAIGLFILPTVIAILMIAEFARSTSTWNWSQWNDRVRFWGITHGFFLLLGAAATCVAFVSGLMYMKQSNKLKHKKPPRFGVVLPSLEQSERWNRWAITIAFPLLTFGLLIGMILNVAARGEAGRPIAWTDPKILSASAMWFVFAVLIHARFRPAMRGRRVVALTMIAFAFLVFTWSITLILPSEHDGPKSRDKESRNSHSLNRLKTDVDSFAFIFRSSDDSKILVESIVQGGRS